MSETCEVTAESWSHVQDLLYEESWDPGINRYRPSFAYRGLSKKSYGLPTSLIRLGDNDAHGARIETDILRNFLKYDRDRTLSRSSVWHQLSVAQHYGLPTRILDWTYSPFVGLHFATNNMDRMESDGAVWMVDIEKVHEKLPEEFKKSLKNAYVFTTKMMAKHAETLNEFDRYFNKSDNELVPVFFEPPALDDRIVNQFALFTIFPDASRRLDDWITNHPDCYKKVVIPNKVKMVIRDKLDAANITERMLFPGLDGLADWLQRYYTPVTEDQTLPP